MVLYLAEESKFNTLDIGFGMSVMHQNGQLELNSMVNWQPV